MIQRAVRFSPNSVDKDLAILEAVAERLRQQGSDVEILSEESQAFRESSLQADAVFSMGRLPETLVKMKTRVGQRQINRPEGVENCARSRLQQLMEQMDIPTAPREGSDGYWLKRGDSAAQTQGDVVYAADCEALDEAIRRMEQRGITDYVVSAHVKGDLVKFYGVHGGFFRYYYPTDDGQTKFDDESHNGEASHFPFDVLAMQQESERLAAVVGIEVYGGDCIVRADGSFCFIDFNDWPSFSRCKKEAVEAIVGLLKD